MDQNYPTQYQNINSTPLIQDSVPPVSRNQQIPSHEATENLKAGLRSSSAFVQCPYCKNQAMTKTVRSCSICNIFCCICTATIPWLLFQACRGKDINCYDANHYCTRCGNNLANYRAC